MKEWIPRIKELVDKEKPFAVARVANTWRSSPRPVGSTMIVLASGEILGSVSGGCVEISVVKKAMEIMASGQPQLVHYGITDDEAWEVGLSCGGQLDVLIQPAQDFSWEAIFKAVDQNEPFCLINSLQKEWTQQASFDIDLNLSEEMKDQYQSGRSGIIENEDKRYFLHAFPAPYVLLLIGAAHLTSELLTLAQWYGFESVVIDPRYQFAKNSFSANEPDQFYPKWPQEVLPKLRLHARTFAVILSHDPKIDDPALHILLKADVAYVGALGSRKTHAKRIERLLSQGMTKAQVDQIDAPIGIDIGSHSAKEIALSIMAGMIQVKNKKCA